MPNVADLDKSVLAKHGLIYGCIVETNGHVPRIAIGSACALRNGAQERMAAYSLKSRLPRHVAHLISEEGHAITSMVVLILLPLD